MVKTFPIEQLINLTDIHKTLEWIVLEREFRKYRYIFIIFVNAFLFRSSDEDTHNEARVKKKNLMTHVNEFVILFTVNYSMHTCFNRESVPSYLS